MEFAINRFMHEADNSYLLKLEVGVFFMAEFFYAALCTYAGFVWPAGKPGGASAD